MDINAFEDPILLAAQTNNNNNNESAELIELNRFYVLNFYLRLRGKLKLFLSLEKEYEFKFYLEHLKLSSQFLLFIFLITCFLRSPLYKLLALIYLTMIRLINTTVATLIQR